MTAEKTLAVIGAIVLFASWCVQQFLFAEWNSALNRIGTNEAVFHSYRASDRVFRALRVASPQSAQEISVQQLKNFDNGLAVLRQTIDGEIYAATRVRAMESIVDGLKYDDLSADGKILLEFDVVATALAKERAVLMSKKEGAERTFVVLYILGSLLAIAALVIKARRGTT